MNILKNVGKFKDYDKDRNNLTYQTTFLSAHNHFSTVSIREVYYAFYRKFGKSHGIINELYWRDFYSNITYFFPYILKGQLSGKNQAFQKKYNSLNWSKNARNFTKWCKGETGFPIIDAGQRQLNATGFMHNRCRMCTSMFLTKDLHISWQEGEKYFANHLVDYSPMQNNGGWQWAASTGCDPQPYFRVFNPYLQSQKFDPEGVYIKKYIPELKHCTGKLIHEPQQDLMTRDYPPPIVDHSIQRQEALALYKFKE